MTDSVGIGAVGQQKEITGFVPTVKLVGRDAAHASTSLLKKPFQKYPELNSLMEEFVSDEDSFCRKVPH